MLLMIFQCKLQFKEEKKVDYLGKYLPAKLNSYEKFLGGRQYFCGDSPTFPDFHMYELLDQHRMLAPDQIKAHKKIDGFLSRFESLPKINAYKRSSRYVYQY